jgi:hypothetical protein
MIAPAQELGMVSGQALLSYSWGLPDWGGSPREEAEPQPDEGRIYDQTGKGRSEEI